jgi:hypothetical protein
MRTHVVLGLFLLLACREAFAADLEARSRVAAEMTEAAAKFVASLSDEQRAKAVMNFDDPRRLDWHNIPKPERKGVKVRDMTPEQRELCHELLKAALSDKGYEKAVHVLALENNLREGEKHIPNGHLRDPERYFLTIFGDPKGLEPWGWSFEGHHFSLNFALAGDRVISDTPEFWGANPATVKTFVEGGPEVGTRTLDKEEQLAFDLLASLEESQRRVAIVAEKAPADYRGPGSPRPPRSPAEGLPYKEMTQAQQRTLYKLVVAYSSHLAHELAMERIKGIEARGFEEVHFAWYGADQPGVGHAYRVQGPTFVLELVNVQSDPAGNPANHIHSVWRSLEGDFGMGGK